MKYRIAIILGLLSTTIYAQINDMPLFEVNLGINPGFLSAGMQKRFFSDVLTPTPTSFPSFGGYMTAQYFPFTNWGIFIGRTQYILSVQGTNTNQIKVLQTDSINWGLSFRKKITTKTIYFGDDPLNTGYSLHANIGTSYSFLQYKDDFKQLIPSGYTLSNITPNFGFYVDCGFNLYIGKFRICIVIEDSLVTGKSGSNDIFDGNYITVPIFLGYGFGTLKK